jgi:Tfp pilus assembly protein PilW
MSGRAESGGSPGLLPGGARVVGIAATAMALAACWLVSASKASQQVDSSQFADSTGGAAAYALTVATRAMFTPPLEYVTVAIGVALGAFFVVGLVVIGLDGVLDLGLLDAEDGR